MNLPHSFTKLDVSLLLVTCVERKHCHPLPKAHNQTFFDVAFVSARTRPGVQTTWLRNIYMCPLTKCAIFKTCRIEISQLVGAHGPWPISMLVLALLKEEKIYWLGYQAAASCMVVQEPSSTNSACGTRSSMGLRPGLQVWVQFCRFCRSGLVPVTQSSGTTRNQFPLVPLASASDTRTVLTCQCACSFKQSMWWDVCFLISLTLTKSWQ